MHSPFYVTKRIEGASSMGNRTTLPSGEAHDVHYAPSAGFSVLLRHNDYVGARSSNLIFCQIFPERPVVSVSISFTAPSSTMREAAQLVYHAERASTLQPLLQSDEELGSDTEIHDVLDGRLSGQGIGLREFLLLPREMNDQNHDDQ